MVLRVHGPCTETVRALAGFKLSARGVQTQHAVPPPAVHCPPTPNATCLTRSPHHCAALATFALARRRSSSPREGHGSANPWGVTGTGAHGYGWGSGHYDP